MNRAWLYFWLLGGIWGSSFLLMRIAVVEIPPAQLAFLRIAIAALGMNVVLFLTRRSYPTNPDLLRGLVIVGIGNTAVPFTLLAWGEQIIPSGLTSVIQAIVPVFSLIIAHFAFHDERMTPTRVAGVLLGFTGIVILSATAPADTAQHNATVTDPLLGVLAIVAASLCYGIFTVYSRRVYQQHKPDAITVSTVTMTSAALVTFAFMFLLPFVGERAPVNLLDVSGGTLLATAFLGFVNTFIAYLLFYDIIPILGAARSSMVTYVVPIVAVALGALAQEPVTPGMIGGAALIMSGIVLANWKLFFRARTPLDTPLAKPAE